MARGTCPGACFSLRTKRIETTWNSNKANQEYHTTPQRGLPVVGQTQRPGDEWSRARGDSVPRPVGTSDNSPAFQRRVHDSGEMSPEGTVERVSRVDGFPEVFPKFSRPFGTCAVPGVIPALKRRAILGRPSGTKAEASLRSQSPGRRDGRRWVARATGPCCRATGPAEWKRGLDGNERQKNQAVLPFRVAGCRAAQAGCLCYPGEQGRTRTAHVRGLPVWGQIQRPGEGWAMAKIGPAPTPFPRLNFLTS